MDDAPDGNTWWYGDTKTMFPEIVEWLPKIRMGFTNERANEIRKDCLKDSIKSLEVSK